MKYLQIFFFLKFLAQIEIAKRELVHRIVDIVFFSVKMKNSSKSTDKTDLTRCTRHTSYPLLSKLIYFSCFFARSFPFERQQKLLFPREQF